MILVAIIVLAAAFALSISLCGWWYFFTEYLKEMENEDDN